MAATIQCLLIGSLHSFPRSGADALFAFSGFGKKGMKNLSIAGLGCGEEEEEEREGEGIPAKGVELTIF